MFVVLGSLLSRQPHQMESDGNNDVRTSEDCGSGGRVLKNWGSDTLEKNFFMQEVSK